MVTATTRCELPASTDWKALLATICERSRLYEKMPGLRSKAFVSSETFRGAIARFGTPEARIHEVLAYVEGGH